MCIFSTNVDWAVFCCTQVLQSAKEQLKWSLLKWGLTDICPVRALHFDYVTENPELIEILCIQKIIFGYSYVGQKINKRNWRAIFSLLFYYFLSWWRKFFLFLDSKMIPLYVKIMVVTTVDFSDNSYSRRLFCINSLS